MRLAAVLAAGLLLTVACGADSSRLPQEAPRQGRETQLLRRIPPAPPPDESQSPLDDERGGWGPYRFPEPEHPLGPTRRPDVPPRLIHSVEPEVPPEARKARVSGFVILELVVEADGRVSGGKVLKPLPFGLTKSAIEAVKHWRFEPARKRGAPVASYYRARIAFDGKGVSP